MLAFTVLAVAGCDYRFDEKLQGDIDTMRDAMNHCKVYTRNQLPDDVNISVSIDHLSSRLYEDGFEVYLDVRDLEQNGYVQCKVDNSGYIVHHGIYGFKRKTKSFSGF